MSKKVIIILIFSFLVGCQFKTKLNSPVHLENYSKNIECALEIKERKPITLLKEKKYLYYGVLRSRLLPKGPKEVFIRYKNEKSEIYPDVIAYSPNDSDFWSLSRWDENGLREDKVYIILKDDSIDWSQVKIIEE